MRWPITVGAGALLCLVLTAPAWAQGTGAASVAGTVKDASGAVLPVGSSRVDLQACKLEYSIVSPK